MNKSWAAERGNSLSSWSSNEKAAAYLSAPSQWTTYYDSTKANYAIGSPSIEIYMASYNQVTHTIGNYTLGATYRATSYPGYIYTLNGKKSTISGSDYYTGTDSLDYTGYNSMYCGLNGSISTGMYFWWLASPSANNSNNVCNMGGFLTNNHYSETTIRVCPLVSLKSGIKLIITSE